MDYDSLVSTMHDVMQSSPTVGVVLSRPAWYDLKKGRFKHDTTSQVKVNEPMPLMDTPLYPFSDVPDEEVWLFRDREALTQYLELREELGHRAAIQRIQADVDDELVVEAEIRALIDKS